MDVRPESLARILGEPELPGPDDPCWHDDEGFSNTPKIRKG